MEKSIRDELHEIMAQAVVATAGRPQGRRGPWIFDEAALQEKARHARKFLDERSEAALKSGSE